MSKLAIFARRAVTATWRSTSQLKHYCSHPPPVSAPDSTKLFVGGLSPAVNEKSLLDTFSKFGEVTEVRILYDKDTGRSRYFGFVNFSKGDGAKLAKEAMDGKVFSGRPLRISFALDKVRGTPIVVPQRNRKS